jgi:peptide/nickel transport system permease protein
MKADKYNGNEKIESLAYIAWRRFRQHKLAVVSCMVLFLLVVVCFGAPLFTPYDPLGIDFEEKYLAPNKAHIFGTDELGRDVWTRTIYGGRISLLVGFAAAAISTIIGVVLGSCAGYFGRVADMLIMRFVDVMMTFPPLIIMLTVAAIAGPGIINVILVIGGLRWPQTARLVRGQFLVLRNQEFILAAHSQGLPHQKIIFNHCLPNIVAPLMARISFAVSSAILSEAGLSFLGIGVPLPIPTWGNMMQQARTLKVLQLHPWMWVFPALFTLVTIMCINFIGDGLRDAFDPQQMIV